MGMESGGFSPLSTSYSPFFCTTSFCPTADQKLGLCNSSNRVEKDNDLVVARRQKHDGMSWSPSGAIALAALAIAARNDEIRGWFRTGEIKFELAV
jgi:hypothetical protein